MLGKDKPLKTKLSHTFQVLHGILIHLKWSNTCFYQVQELAKSVDVYDLLETSFDQLDQEINTSQSNNYSSDKCNSQFRHKKGRYAPKEPKQWKSVIRNFMTANDIQKLTSASRFILNK